MGNTWNGMTFTNIARTGFKAFNTMITKIFDVFATDFSSEIPQGTVVQTRIVPVSDAAVDLQTGVAGTAGDRADSNIIKDITTTAISVTLNQQPIAGFSLTDEEAMTIGAGVWEDTKTKIIAQKGYAVAYAVWKYIVDLITNANYSTAVHVGAASAFDLDDVVDIGSTLKKTYAWEPDQNELLGTMVVNSDYKGALKKDNSIQDLSASGIDVARSGKLEKVDQFALLEAPGLPPSGGTPESENLTGFVAKPSAIAVAMRVVASQASDKLMWFEVMTDPTTGATLVYRAWYNLAYGKVYHTFETLFGASKGQAEALKRITSA